MINRNEKIDTSMRHHNHDFYQRLVTGGLETDDSSNYYILQHLYGLHPPYVTDKDCKYVEKSSKLEAERGCWLYVEEYLNQLKALGIYDDATIIITADYGKHHDYYDAQPIFFIKSPNEEHDKYVETNAPISFTDIMPTVLYLIGADYDDFGTTFYEHKENEKRERTLYIRMLDKDLPKVPKVNSPSYSILNCFYEYQYTGDKEDLRKLGKKGPTEKLLWTDAFY